MRPGAGAGIRAGTRLFSAGRQTYSLIRPLPPGGNSTTFIALCRSGIARGTPFAVKFFTSTKQPRRDAFLKELKFLNERSHPAILSVFDFGTTINEEIPYYISALMSKTLRHVVQQQFEGVTQLDRFLYAAQLCAAVTFLSNSAPPIVHRDIKPDNVFLNGSTCVLGDFGMMCREGEEGVDPGTPRNYRSPELVSHLNGGPPPPRSSDLYQLGLVLYELLAGENPQRPCADLREPITLNPLPKLSAHLGPAMGGLLPATLADEPSQRPGAEMLLEAFEDLVIAEGRRLTGT